MRERGLNRPEIRSEREHSKVPFLFHLAYFMALFSLVFSSSKKALAKGSKGFFGGAHSCGYTLKVSTSTCLFATKPIFPFGLVNKGYILKI
jgi:hypothetical protein